MSRKVFNTTLHGVMMRFRVGTEVRKCESFPAIRFSLLDVVFENQNTSDLIDEFFDAKSIGSYFGGHQFGFSSQKREESGNLVLIGDLGCSHLVDHRLESMQKGFIFFSCQAVIWPENGSHNSNTLGKVHRVL